MTTDPTVEHSASPALSGLLEPIRRRPTRLGLVSGGLGAYWPQFPDLLPQLRESARYVTERFTALDAEVTDVGFVSDAQEAAVAAERLRQADCDLIVMFITTYLTSSMVLPIAQRTPSWRMPLGIWCSTNECSPRSTVCPALAPPW